MLSSFIMVKDVQILPVKMSIEKLWSGDLS